MEKKVNQEILKKYFSGLHGLVPSKPTPNKPITGKVSDSRLVKTPTYP
jgi:hypothetical protein